MTESIEKQQIVVNVWLCGRGHKHTSLELASQCEAARKRVELRKSKKAAKAKALEEKMRGHIKTSIARDRFRDSNGLMSDELICLMYKCGLLRGFRNGDQMRGKLYIREDDVDSLIVHVRRRHKGHK